MMRDTLTKEQLFSLRAGVPDENIYNEIKRNWDHLSKPIDGFGEFEDVICRIGAILGKRDVFLKSRKAVIFCADNGIIEEGVSQAGKEVTLQVARMLGQGISSANTLGVSVGCDVIPVDIGIDDRECGCADGVDGLSLESSCPGGKDGLSMEGYGFGEIPGVRPLRVRCGTENFLKQYAMTLEDALKAIGTGIDLAKELRDGGIDNAKMSGEGGADIARKVIDGGTDIIITGEMGIGNTTTASALMCLLTGAGPSEIVGRGAGLDDEGLERKVRVVEKAVKRFWEDEDVSEGSFPGIDKAEDNRRKELALAALAKVGGLDIAGLCGLFIGGSLYGIPVVIDGFIAAVAALLAECFVSGAKDSMIPSHSGREKGLLKALELLELNPLINGNMALGEGTGAMMLLPLLDAALSFYRNAKTFEDGKIKEYQRFK